MKNKTGNNINIGGAGTRLWLANIYMIQLSSSLILVIGLQLGKTLEKELKVLYLIIL